MPIFYCVTIPADDSGDGYLRAYVRSFAEGKRLALEAAKAAKDACREDLICLTLEGYRTILEALNERLYVYNTVWTYEVQRKETANGKYSDELTPQDFKIVGVDYRDKPAHE